LTAILFLSLATDVMHVAYAYTYVFKEIPLYINLVGKMEGEVWKGATITPAQAKAKIDAVNEVYKKWGIGFTPTYEANGDIKINKKDDPEKQAGTEWGEVTWKDRNDHDTGLLSAAEKDEVKEKGLKLYFVKRILTPANHTVNDVTDANANGVSVPCHPVAFVEELIEPEHDEAAIHTIAHEFVHGLGLVDQVTDPKKLTYNKGTSGTELSVEEVRQIRVKADERGSVDGGKGIPTTPMIRDNLNGFPVPWYIDMHAVSWSTSTDLTEGGVRIYLFGTVPSAADGLYYFVGFDVDGNNATGATFGNFSGIERKLIVSKTLSGWSADLVDAVTGNISVPNLAVMIRQSYEAFQMEIGYEPPPPTNVTDVIYVSLPTQYLEPLAEAPRFGAYALEASSGYYDETDMMQFTRITGPILDLSSLAGMPGDNVTATGRLFAPSTTVHLLFDLEWIKSVVTDDQGNFSTTFNVPLGTPGAHYIDAVDISDNIAFRIFTIRSSDDVAVTAIVQVKTVVAQNCCCLLNITVANVGNSTESFNVGAYYGNNTLQPEQWDIFWSMGDCNRDGYINGTDVSIILANWLWHGPPGGNPADINSDGVVDMYDLIICSSHQGHEIWEYFLAGGAIGTQAVINLPPGNFASLNFTWNTTGLSEYQNFTVSAYAWPVPNEVYVADNSLGGGNVAIVHAGDINGDGKIDVKDVAKICSLYGVKYPDPKYDPNSDVTGPTQGLADGKIDVRDVALVSSRYGWHK
jgi:hypothetical protein